MLSNLGKIFERVIAYRLDQFCELNNIIPWNQFGFKEKFATEQALLTLSDIVTRNLREKHCTLALDLDIEKAFDSVWTNGILYKLQLLQCPSFLIKILRNFLSDRYLKICINNYLSDKVVVNSGVPQGSVLGPKLFNIFLNDFPFSSPNRSDIQALLHADDTLILTNGVKPADAFKKLQSSIHILEKYYLTWEIKVNQEKSGIICIRNASGRCHRNTVSESKNLKLTLLNKPISIKKSIKYLGINIHERFIFNPHAKNMLNRSRYVTSKIKILLNSNHVLPKTKLLLYKTIVRPILAYAFSFWFTISPSTAAKMEKFERMMLRFCTGLFRKQDKKWFSNKTLYKVSDIKPLMQYLVFLMDKTIMRTKLHHSNHIKQLFESNYNDSLTDHFYHSPFNIVHERSKDLIGNNSNLSSVFYTKKIPHSHRG